MKIFTYNTTKDVCYALAQYLAKRSKQGGTIALSGGNTPKMFFNILVESFQDINWNNFKFFWGDERIVPSSSPESNFGVFSEIVINKGIISKNSVFPIPFFSDEKKSLSFFKKNLQKEINLDEDNIPSFDFIILGVGEDGHIASIFPNNLKSFKSTEFAEITIHPQTQQHRISLTGTTINHAKNIIFLCTGNNKKKIIKEIIIKKNQQLPATLVNPQKGTITWFTDQQIKEDV